MAEKQSDRVHIGRILAAEDGSRNHAPEGTRRRGLIVVPKTVTRVVR